MKRLWPLLLVMCVFGSVCSAQTLVRQLGEGVELQRFEVGQDGKPQMIHVVTVDMQNPSVQLSAALGKDVVMLDDTTKGRETISALTARKNAVVGVNGDYFPFTGDPLNLCVVDGNYVSEPGHNRVVLGMTDTKQLVLGQPGWNASVSLPDGRSQKIGGINRPAGPNECILYTSLYGPKVTGKYPIKLLRLSGIPDKLLPGTYTPTVDSTSDMDPFSTSTTEWLLAFTGATTGWLDEAMLGKQITVQIQMRSPADTRISPNGTDATANSDIWSRLRWAVGGGPWLLRDGEPYVNAVSEGISEDISAKRHPRTAAGIDASGRLLLVTVDGRRSSAAGMTLAELAAYMKSIGAVNAINLDGGGSTTMALYNGRLANIPSDDPTRPVANGILLFTKPYTLQPLADLSVWPGSIELVSGQQTEFNLMGFDVPESVAGDVIWTISSHLGRISPAGVFTAEHAGTAYINAFFDDHNYRALVTVNP